MHAPQCNMLVLRLVSQPSPGMPLQLSQPGLQLATWQLPDEQSPVPFETVHDVPQAVQSVFVLS